MQLQINTIKKSFFVLFNILVFMILTLLLSREVFGIEMPVNIDLSYYGFQTEDLTRTRDGSVSLVHVLTDDIKIQNYLRDTNSSFYGTEVFEVRIFSHFENEPVSPHAFPPIIPPALTEERVLNIVGTPSDGWIFRDNPLQISSFVYPGGSMSVSRGVGVTWSSTASINAGFLTSQLGYSHTSNFNVNNTQNISVPSGRRATVTAFAYHRRTDFETRLRNILTGAIRFEGSGWSARPNGVRFETVIH